MALFTESELRARARQKSSVLAKTFDSVLREHVIKQEKIARHDVFLSHAYEDKELISGAAAAIEDLGYNVYLDWRDDPQLDRSKVTAATAERLRSRLRTSRSLFYSTTAQSSSSKWMPWELGFQDGANSRAAILPVSSSGQGDDYKGQEYLGIYPYITRGQTRGGVEKLWVHSAASRYINFDEWLLGKEPYDH